MGTMSGKKKMVTGVAFWKKANSYRMGLHDVIEVPFLSRSNYVFLYGFGLEDSFRPIDEQQARVQASYTSLLVYRKNDQSVDKAFVTYIPDYEYLRNKNSATDRITQDNLPADFSGYLEYRNWEQDVLFVLRVDGGEAVRRYQLRAISSNSIQKYSSLDSQTGPNGNVAATGATTNCQTVCTPIYQTICVDPPEGPGGGNQSPYCTTTQVGENCTQVCDDDEDPSTDPPNPGGGGENPDGPPPMS